MKKNIYKLLGIILFGTLLTVSTVKGATILFPQGGGTGIGSVTAGNIGNCLTVSNNSPFTYSLGACGSGSSSISTSTNPLMATYFVATSTTATSTFAGGITGPGLFTVQSSSGNVGVGTTTPTGKLQVTNTPSTATDNELLTLQNFQSWGGSQSGKFQQITWRDNVSVAGAIGMVYNSPTVDFTVNSLYNSGFKSTTSIPFIVKGSGNVGISTTTPWGILSVTNTGTGPSFVVEDSSSPDTTPFIIDASGNVGIGTTTPNYKLDVNSGAMGIGNTTSGYLFSNSKREIIAGMDTTGFYFAGGAGTGITNPIHIGSNNDYLRIYAGGSERMRVVGSSGNIGISTTTPWGKLSVTNTGTGPSFVVEDDTSPDTTPFIIDASGNVGIGTNVLTEKLNVTGNIAASGYFIYNGNSFNEFRVANDAGSGYFTFDGYGDRLFLIPGGGVGASSGITYRDSSENDKILFSFGPQTLATFNSNAAGYKIMELKGAASQSANFFDISSSAGTGDVFTLLSSGNVGIGTTSPNSKLTVNGSAYIAGQVYATSTVFFTGLTTSSGTPNSICQNATTREITVNAALTCTVSDINQKNSIEALSNNGIEIIEQIKPVQFKYNDSDRLRWGFIAQELQDIDPKLGDGYVETVNGIEAHSIDIPAITAITIKAIKEQQDEIKLLRSEIELLKNK